MLQLDNIELGIYGLVGIIFVLFLHIVFKNILFSIFCGTLFYLVLRNHDLIFDTISF